MSYRMFTLHVVVNSDDVASVSQEFDSALAKLKGQHKIYSAEYSHDETPEPGNAAEVVTPLAKASPESAAPGEESSDDQYDKG
jgi:hypothetical protein